MKIIRQEIILLLMTFIFAAPPSRAVNTAEGIPRFIEVDYIELGKISAISKFRSGIGHDYSDEFESCRTMKHYYKPTAAVDWSQVKIFSPVGGTVVNVYPEWAGTKLGITPTGYPDYTVEIFHVDLMSPLNVGDSVAAAQQLGTHIGSQTMSDIAIRFNDAGGWRLISYFDAMSDRLFSSYQARGIRSRTDMIISREERDADPLECDGETYLTPPDPDDWVALAYNSVDDGDYDGDGTSEIAIFRTDSSLWGIRGITRIYFGNASDIPVSGDYDGDGTTDIAIFRGGGGLWAIRGVSRVYFGSATDLPVPGDYDGDGCCDATIFRENSGLWAVRGVSRVYFGQSGDRPVPGYYKGGAGKDIGLFRGSSGLWAIRNFTRVYFGNAADMVVPGDFSGAGTWKPAIFRLPAGLWAIRGLTRVYFGGSADEAVPADYDGGSGDDIGIFRGTSGLWAVRNITRAYYGSSGDIPVTR